MVTKTLGPVLAAAASLLALPALADNSIIAAQTVAVTGPKIIRGVAPGDVLPMDYMVVLGTQRRGLPQPKNGWVYFDVDGQVVKADLASRKVIERVTLANGRPMMLR